MFTDIISGSPATPLNTDTKPKFGQSRCTD